MEDVGPWSCPCDRERRSVPLAATLAIIRKLTEKYLFSPQLSFQSMMYHLLEHFHNALSDTEGRMQMNQQLFARQFAGFQQQDHLLDFERFWQGFLKPGRTANLKQGGGSCCIVDKSKRDWLLDRKQLDVGQNYKAMQVLS